MKIEIDIYYFFISLFFGIFFIYITTPKPKIILKYNESFNNLSNKNYNIEKIICS